MATEYRVIWQREGQAKKRALYQTLAGAERCKQRQATAHEEMTWLADSDSPFSRLPPPIVFGPVIEAREVGTWAAAAGVRTEGTETSSVVSAAEEPGAPVATEETTT